MGEEIRGEGKGEVRGGGGGGLVQSATPITPHDEIPRSSLSIVGYWKQPNTEGSKAWEGGYILSTGPYITFPTGVGGSV